MTTLDVAFWACIGFNALSIWCQICKILTSFPAVRRRIDAATKAAAK